MNRKELKELYQQHRTVSAVRSAAGCLSEEILMRAGAGDLSLAERQRVTSHLRICSGCAQDYLAARSLKSWAEQVSSPSSLAVDLASEDVGTQKQAAPPIRLAGRFFTGPRNWTLVAASAVVLAAAGISLTLWRTNPPIEEPTLERGGISSSMTFEPANRALLREPPARLAWSAVEPAELYQVALYDVESTLIWESEPVKDTSITIPEAVRQRLSAQPYYWRVFVDTGTERRQLPLLQFIVAAEPR